MQSQVSASALQLSSQTSRIITWDFTRLLPYSNGHFRIISESNHSLLPLISRRTHMPIVGRTIHRRMS